VLVPLVPDYNEAFGLRPRSKEQRMALELLMDPEVDLVTLIGQAGTGKPLLALAAGLTLTLSDERYETLLVTRAGYSPGPGCRVFSRNHG